MRLWRTTLLAALGLSLVHCDGSETKPQEQGQALTEVARHGLTAEQASQVLFEVGGRKITVGEYADRLHALSPYLRARYTSVERRREFLENMIRFELLATAAEERGLLQSPEVQRTRQDKMIEAMMEKLFADGELKPAPVSEQAIADYYAQHKGDFVQPPQVRASQVVLPTLAEAKKVLSELRERDDREAAIADLAKARSADRETALRDGDMRFFSLTPGQDGAQIPEAIRKAAFALQAPGDLVEAPVKTEQGFVVLMLTARREALQRSLEDATPIIRNLLWRRNRQQAIDTFVAQLRSNANIEEHPEMLNQLDGAADTETHETP